MPRGQANARAAESNAWDSLTAVLAARFRTPGFLSLVLLASFATAAAAAAPSSGPPLPLGIEFLEPLGKGEWAVSYRYDRIEWDGNRIDREKVSIAEIDDNFDYLEVPIDQTADVHTFGLRWAPWSRLTLALDIPYVENRSNTALLDPWQGDSYATEATGVGDLRIQALVPFMKKNREVLQVAMGFSAPTGSIRYRDEFGRPLPYDMQIGDGTWSFLAALTYHGYWHHTGWGVRGTVATHMGTNDHGYRIGPRYGITAWLTQGLTSWLSGGVRFGWAHQNNIRGNRTFGPPANPASDGYLRGGDRVDIGPGLTLALPFFGEQRLSVEAMWPVLQDLDGPQLDRKWTVSTGWQWVF